MTKNMDDSININIQYFAVLREITGCASESISVQANSTPKSVYTKLINQYDNSKELYNLELDPDEKNNLIDNGENIERTLLEKLNYFMNKKD